MLYLTHRKFAIFWALAGIMYLYTKGLTEINYYLALMMVIPFSEVGALFPDLDHDWSRVKVKNPITFIVNRLIHWTGGTHRSWQTHSIDIALLVTFLSYFLPQKLYEMGKLSLVNKEVLSIMMIGFSFGWLSHIFSDMMTSGKVKLFCFLNWRVGFVPKSVLGFKFNTGGQWEAFVYRITDGLNIGVGTLALIFPILMKHSIITF